MPAVPAWAHGERRSNVDPFQPLLDLGRHHVLSAGVRIRRYMSWRDNHA